MAEKKSATPSPVDAATRSADRKSRAGETPDPWQACVKLEYGGDRSFAWSVREQIISTPPERRAEAEDRLLKALALPGCTDAGRQFICQMLAMVGSVKSVPALAPLLRDPKSTESARYALQPVAGPAADAAFREALGSLTGAAKAGLIGSIALRGDSSARYALAGIKDNPVEAAVVREAASRALEYLANAKA
jgi:hypothetical protein